VLVWSRPLPRWLPRTSAVLLVRVGEGRSEWARGRRLHGQIQTRVRRFYDLHDRDGQVLSGSVFEGVHVEDDPERCSPDESGDDQPGDREGLDQVPEKEEQDQAAGGGLEGDLSIGGQLSDLFEDAGGKDRGVGVSGGECEGHDGSPFGSRGQFPEGENSGTSPTAGSDNPGVWLGAGA